MVGSGRSRVGRGWGGVKSKQECRGGGVSGKVGEGYRASEVTKVAQEGRAEVERESEGRL